MKFENVKNVERLFQIIRDECSGTVELVSSEGDRINLKSRLSQYISARWRVRYNGEITAVAGGEKSVSLLDMKPSHTSI